MSIDANRQYLQSVGIFSGLPDGELRELATRMQARDFQSGAVIVGQEDAGDSLFIVTAGRVKVVLYGDSGREMILTFLGPGEIFGEMSLLDNQPRSASVIALEPTRVLVLERATFQRHLRAYPDTGLAILAEMSRRLRQADRVIGNLALLDVYGRVARVLQDIAIKDGTETEEGRLIRERPTQQEIASMVGTSRETVSRALSDFQRRGLVVMQGKQILLRPGFEVEDIDSL